MRCCVEEKGLKGGEGRGDLPSLAWPRLITFHSSFIHKENRSNNNNLSEQSNKADFSVLSSSLFSDSLYGRRA